MGEKKEKTNDATPEIQAILQEFPEIVQALEAMRRIVAVEDVKARNVMELPPTYVEIS